MKRIRLIILPAALALMLAIPQTAAAAGNTANGRLKWVDCRKAAIDQTAAENPPQGGCKDGKCKGMHREDEAAFRIYSVLTGKTADELKKACAKDNLTIWQLAKKEGKLDALKTRMLNVKAASLDELVKGGVMTDEERNRILTHIKDELDKK